MKVSFLTLLFILISTPTIAQPSGVSVSGIPGLGGIVFPPGKTVVEVTNNVSGTCMLCPITKPKKILRYEEIEIEIEYWEREAEEHGRLGKKKKANKARANARRLRADAERVLLEIGPVFFKTGWTWVGSTSNFTSRSFQSYVTCKFYESLTNDRAKMCTDKHVIGDYVGLWGTDVYVGRNRFRVDGEHIDRIKQPRRVGAR